MAPSRRNSARPSWSITARQWWRASHAPGWCQRRKSFFSTRPNTPPPRPSAQHNPAGMDADSRRADAEKAPEPRLPLAWVRRHKVLVAVVALLLLVFVWLTVGSPKISHGRPSLAWRAPPLETGDGLLRQPVSAEAMDVIQPLTENARSREAYPSHDELVLLLLEQLKYQSNFVVTGTVWEQWMPWIEGKVQRPSDVYLRFLSQLEQLPNGTQADVQLVRGAAACTAHRSISSSPRNGPPSTRAVFPSRCSPSHTAPIRSVPRRC